MVLQYKIPQPAAPAIASYSYTDIDEGTGVVIYYGASVDGTGILTRYPIYSEVYGFNGPGYGITTPSSNKTSSSYEEVVTKTFDVVFSAAAKFIKGNMYVVIPIGRASTQVNNMFTMTEIYKLDAASSATLILSGNSSVFSPDVSGVMSANSTQKFVMTGTHFKKGEGLRVKVRLWGNTPTSSNTYYGIGHDPQNRNDPNSTYKTIADTTDTVMQVHIPFRLNN